MSRSLALVSVALGLTLASGHASAEIHIASDNPVQDRLNIDIPTKDITAEDVSGIIQGFASFIKEGHTDVPITQVSSSIKVPAEFEAVLQKLIASRDATAGVDCIGRKCVITSTGQATNFKVDGVSIPVLGTPNIYVEKTVEIYAEVAADETKAEICRINGLSVKAGLIKSTVDGMLVQLDGDAVKTFRVDAGAGGDYPNDNCRWAPGSVPNIPADDGSSANAPANSDQDPATAPVDSGSSETPSPVDANS